MTRQLTPQELAGLLSQRIPGSYRIGQTTGANPGQSIQIDGVAAVARSVIPPGRAVAVNIGGQWQAYPEPALAAPSERIVTSVRRRPKPVKSSRIAIISFLLRRMIDDRLFVLKSVRVRTTEKTPPIKVDNMQDVGVGLNPSIN
jgi:hypothetical protein